MDGLKTGLMKIGGHLLGAGLIVAGWWISMLNMSIDRFSGVDYVNFWTVTGLVLIFIGAYIPAVISKWVDRKRRKEKEAKAKLEVRAAEVAQEQAAAQAGVSPPEPPVQQTPPPPTPPV